MSRQAHFLDPYQFQIEEMVKLGCSDEHICRVLEDITGKEVKKRVIANKRMWLRKMENKRKQYEPYKGEIKYMIEKRTYDPEHLCSNKRRERNRCEH